LAPAIRQGAPNLALYAIAAMLALAGAYVFDEFVDHAEQAVPLS